MKHLHSLSACPSQEKHQFTAAAKASYNRDSGRGAAPPCGKPAARSSAATVAAVWALLPVSNRTSTCLLKIASRSLAKAGKAASSPPPPVPACCPCWPAPLSLAAAVLRLNLSGFQSSTKSLCWGLCVHAEGNKAGQEEACHSRVQIADSC